MAQEPIHVLNARFNARDFRADAATVRAAAENLRTGSRRRGLLELAATFDAEAEKWEAAAVREAV